MKANNRRLSTNCTDRSDPPAITVAEWQRRHEARLLEQEARINNYTADKKILCKAGKGIRIATRK